MTLGAPVPEGGCLVSFPGGDTGTSNYQDEGNYCRKLYVVKDVSLDRTAVSTMEVGMFLPISSLQVAVHPIRRNSGSRSQTQTCIALRIAA